MATTTTTTATACTRQCPSYNRHTHIHTISVSFASIFIWMHVAFHSVLSFFSQFQYDSVCATNIVREWRAFKCCLVCCYSIVLKELLTLHDETASTNDEGKGTHSSIRIVIHTRAHQYIDKVKHTRTHTTLHATHARAQKYTNANAIGGEGEKDQHELVCVRSFVCAWEN